MYIVRVFTTDESFIDFPFSNARLAGEAMTSIVTQARMNAQLIEVSASGEVAGAVPLDKIRFIRLVPVDEPTAPASGTNNFDGTEDSGELPGKSHANV